MRILIRRNIGNRRKGERFCVHYVHYHNIFLPRINPVIGCLEREHSDPMVGMTDEQKEHEAIKLVNLIDQMSRQGVVQPACIGPDGRPEAVEHVLQLINTENTSETHSNESSDMENID